MPTSVNVAVIYYSSTGTVSTIAKAMAGDVESAGAHVRLRKAAELAPRRRSTPIPHGPSTPGRRPTSPRCRRTTWSGPTR